MAGFKRGRNMKSMPRSCSSNKPLALCMQPIRNMGSSCVCPKSRIMASHERARASRIAGLQTRCLSRSISIAKEHNLMCTEQSKSTKALTVLLGNHRPEGAHCGDGTGYAEVVEQCSLQSETAKLQGGKMHQPGNESRKIPRSDRLEVYTAMIQAEHQQAVASTTGSIGDVTRKTIWAGVRESRRNKRRNETVDLPRTLNLRDPATSETSTTSNVHA
ncbi:hypothetical protein P170DRAFT_77439 [Aspergillus steynii IBT 23096]|uniref:Uncharacterized protein n=1 Tax=Aspergillus steynii IBT 23096 TaxID=1392250 RepID=A0A2I2FS33_9EURO|nr:uncharacterized protein P170DRAFT_77439 [Aspergillus steynii IBT 23096]PLB43445.1 hypothetical protein P170DRAFT_77439 [Aspergillus steynii IBT 23096]